MPNADHDRNKAGRTVAVLAGLLALAAIAFLTLNVAHEIRAQGTAESDNVQWSLAQTEVEFQEYYGRLRLGEDLTGIRRRFDVFYSRVKTVGEARVFADLRGSDQFMEKLQDIQTFLDESVLLVDVDDVELTRNLPRLAASAQIIRPSIRELANSGLEFFARRSDSQREAVARTMIQLAIGLAALIAALGIGVAYLIRLNKKISEREREQIQNATRINTIMNTSLDAVVVSDDQGRITGFNRAAEVIFGHNVEDVMGKELGQIIVPDHMRDAHDAGMERMRNHGERRVVGKGRVQLEAKRSSGEVFPVELAIQSATTDKGEIYIAFLRDVSQRVAADAELIEARDKAIAGEQSRSEFLATMSHEIRTPLNGLIGNMSLLRDTRLTPTQDTFLRNMETSGRLLMSHVSDVLDIARYDSGKISARSEPLNISALLQDIVDNQGGMASANETTLDWGWDGAQQNWINGDHDRLQHVLMNLIGNAVKFTKQGRVSVTVSWHNDELTFDIEDTGIGIDEDLQERIFDDFVTGNAAYDRDVGGTGLGLSIVKRFVTALDGTITVSSALGEGSTFRVSMPATKAKPIDQSDTTTETQMPSRPQRVLVVEDNEINRFVVRNMLSADGHDVTEAHDGQQGVEMAYGEAFDLILMDISMPVLDGRGATRKIREGNGASARSRIVALTANVMPEEREDFLANGMDGVLTKPLTKSALRAVLVGEAQHTVSEQGHVLDAAHNAETQDVLGHAGYSKVLAKFHTELDDLVAWMNPAHDHSEIAARAHKVAGNAALFGAVALRQTLVDLEVAAKRVDDTKVAEHIAALPAISQDTKRALTDLVPTDPEQ